MGAKTGIAWCDATWNPWQGCTPVSEGCKNCYMYREKKQYGQDPTKVVRSAAKTFNLPLAKKKDGSWKIPSGSFVFVCSWSDFFHPIADKWRHLALDVMVERPDLTFLILTKRIERVRDLQTCELQCEYDHIWLGVTAENQAMAEARIPKLLEIDWPGKRFVSIEPMLSPVDLQVPWGQGVGDLILDDGRGRLDWIILGAESGPGARPMHPNWARKIRDQCVEAGVPYFLKQMWIDGKLVKMPELDGKVWNQRPEVR